MENLRYYTVTGMFMGEEQKGNSTEFLVSETHAHTVERSGACQSGHHITTSDGREQVFTHFGAGTFEGARTHLNHMVISPMDLFEEAFEIEKNGVDNPFKLITIDENCLIVTPYHSAISRLREILRGPNKKGTVGKGVGEAIIDSRAKPDLAIHAGDLKQGKGQIFHMLENIRQAKLLLAEKLMENQPQTLPSAQIEIDHLKDSSLSSEIAEGFSYLPRMVQITNASYYHRLLEVHGTIVNEADHGVLHHPRMGFVPHITQGDPTSSDVIKSLKEHNYKGRYTRFGVTRCYTTRFGAGPLITEDKVMSVKLRDKNNKDNEWLGPFRVGPYDLVALKYSIQICGGPQAFGGLMISHLDQLARFSNWPVCVGYEFQGKTSDLSEYFDVEKGIIVGIKLYPDTNDANQYNHQLRLTELLKSCKPIVLTLHEKEESLEETFIKKVESETKIPVVVTSYGPTKEDRRIRNGWENLFTA